MLRTAVDRLGDAEGATAIEYAIMVTLIAMAVIFAVAALGGQLNVMFEFVTEKIAEMLSS